MNRFQFVKIVVLFVLTGRVNLINAQIKMIKEQPLTFDGQTISELLDKVRVAVESEYTFLCVGVH